ncbi:MAG: hypothetical protein GQ574_25345 [Crocinitomix sp.]|nr:hypothetical protein [Crocinitomix sp.]
MGLEDFFNKSGLYEKFDFENFTEEQILNIFFHVKQNSVLNHIKSLDSFCVICNQQTTFISADKSNRHLEEILIDLKSKSEGNPSNEDVIRKKGLIDFLNDIGTFHRIFHCPRDPKNHLHNQEYHFLVTDNLFTKIGQYPSVVDKEKYSIQKYRVLKKEIYQELNTAIGLYTHGNGIGSFVYLRRIIEKHMVIPALEKMLGDGEIEKEDTVNIDFKKKMALAKSYLPEYLSENSKIYSILSKGVHELSEKECLKHFTVLRTSIELILDEKISQIEEEKKKKMIRQQLNEIN